MFAVDRDQIQLAALMEAYNELRTLADRWLRAYLERITSK